jgi:hypothetical protein
MNSWDEWIRDDQAWKELIERERIMDYMVFGIGSLPRECALLYPAGGERSRNLSVDRTEPKTQKPRLSKRRRHG